MFSNSLSFLTTILLLFIFSLFILSLVESKEIWNNNNNIKKKFKPLQFPLTYKPRARQEASYNAAYSNPSRVPLRGNFKRVGEYYIKLDIGTPSRSFLVQVSTGSSDLAVPTTKCTTCSGAPDAPYDPSKSSSSRKVSCSQFQCPQHQCTPQGPSLIDSLVSSGMPNIFSMCMGPKGGMMTLGSIGGYIQPHAHYQYTPQTTSSLYSVHINDIRVDGESLGLSPIIYNKGGSIVDSGTTAFQLPSKAVVKMKDVMLRHCDQTNLYGLCGVSNFNQTIFERCFSLTQEQLLAYPWIQIDLKDYVTLQVKPEQYLQKGFCRDSDKYTSLVSYHYKGTVLGDTVMQGYEVVFDRQNHRIGFGEVNNCPIS